MICEHAHAKINLGLAVLGKRSDGYHDIDTVMQSISLFDVIHLEKSNKLEVYCTDPSIPSDGQNTAYKAAEVFFEAAAGGLNERVCIKIEKSIPQKAGLGGGSSDAAAVLRGLNRLYGTDFGTDKLRELGLKVGSDVPFAITGGTSRAEGRGDVLEPLDDFGGVAIVLVMPDDIVETAWAYSLFKEGRFKGNPDMDGMVEAIEKRDLKSLAWKLGNAFEKEILPRKPSIAKTKHDILSTGAVASSMTGSGAAVFGIYENHAKAASAGESLEGDYNVFVCETIGEVV